MRIAPSPRAAADCDVAEAVERWPNGTKRWVEGRGRNGGSNDDVDRRLTDHDGTVQVSVGQSKKRGRVERKKEDSDVEDEELPSDQEEEEVDGSESLPGSDSEEEKETAEEKRIRLAKAYLSRLRQEEMEDESSEDDENEDKIHRDSLANRLQQEALESKGYQQRQLADSIASPEGQVGEAPKVLRGHGASVTAVALSNDEKSIYSCAKDGAMFHWDVETGKGTRFPKLGGAEKKNKADCRVRWLANAISYDGMFLATGGSDKNVHIWDLRSMQHIVKLSSHRAEVTALAFRDGTHQLFSASMDSTVKIWSIDTEQYIDTLYGHQAKVMSIDCGYKERPVSGSTDHTCRLWKVPEESQLVFRGGGASIDAVAVFRGGQQWISGGDDGHLSLWTMMRKKPVEILRDVHGKSASSAAGDECRGWIHSLACARGSDLAASGSGNGFIRLWAQRERHLEALGSLPVNGFVNSLSIAPSGRFVVSGIGQEPRLGRWSKIAGVRNGIVIHRLPLVDLE